VDGFGDDGGVAFGGVRARGRGGERASQSKEVGVAGKVFVIRDVRIWDFNRYS